MYYAYKRCPQERLAQLTQRMICQVTRIHPAPTLIIHLIFHIDSFVIVQRLSFR